FRMTAGSWDPRPAGESRAIFGIPRSGVIGRARPYDTTGGLRPRGARAMTPRPARATCTEAAPMSPLDAPTDSSRPPISGPPAAEALAARLARDPARVSRQWRATRQGCDLLIERWEALGRALDRLGAWDEAQQSLALDLLGVPAVARADEPRLVAGADRAAM